MPQLIMHINYFEQGYDLPTAFDKALQYGFDGIELRGAMKDVSRDDYLNLMARQIKRTGIPSVTVAIPCDLTMIDADHREANTSDAIDLLRKTAALGVHVYNTYAGSLLSPNAPYMEFDKNGSAAASEDQWEWAAEGYRQLGAVAEDLGVRLGFETHNCYIHDLAGATAKLLDIIGSPSIGSNLDYGNIVLNKNGESLDDTIEILKGRIHYVHLKNVYMPVGGGFFVCPMSDGVINNRRFLELLRAIGYEGPIALEAPRQGDRDHFAQEDIGYIRQACNEIGWE